MIHTKSNQQGYTAEQYSADVAAVLPYALSDLHYFGMMTTCGHCGGKHDGGSFAIQACNEQGKIVAVEIVAVCNTCMSKPLLPPEQWRHVGKTSGLFYAEEHWAAAVQGLRMQAWHALLRVVRGPCMIIGGLPWL